MTDVPDAADAPDPSDPSSDAPGAPSEAVLDEPPVTIATTHPSRVVRKTGLLHLPDGWRLHDLALERMARALAAAPPHVAGVAALIAQSDPKFRGWALWARLLQLAHRLNRQERDVGRGLLRAPAS